MCEFLQRYSELAPIILQFTDQLEVFLLPIDGDDRLRERVESAISKKLNEQPGVIGAFQDRDVLYRPRRPKEQPIRMTISFKKELAGLNKEFLI